MQTIEKVAKQPPKNVNLIPVRVADLGNRRVKFLEGTANNPRSIPSFIHVLEDYEDSPEAIDKSSVFLETEGKRIVVGKLAQEMGGRPTYQLNKSELADILIMATIAPLEGCNLPTHIEQLRLCLPDTRDNAGVNNLKSLEGEKTVIRNGRKFQYSVGEVKIYNECVGAFRYARKNNIFNFPEKLNAVADFGGGTFLIKMFSSSGVILREADISLEGTFSLASNISAMLLPRLGKSADLSIIMNAIEAQTYQYGSTDINFLPEFEKCQAKFLETVKLTIKERWSKFFPELGEVILTGGSAPLLLPLADKPSSRFKLVKPHSFINVLGMAL